MGVDFFVVDINGWYLKFMKEKEKEGWQIQGVKVMTTEESLKYVAYWISTLSDKEATSLILFLEWIAKNTCNIRWIRKGENIVCMKLTVDGYRQQYTADVDKFFRRNKKRDFFVEGYKITFEWDEEGNKYLIKHEGDGEQIVDREIGLVIIGFLNHLLGD